MTYAPVRFEIATPNGLGGEHDRPTLVQNQYTLFSKEKGGYNNIKALGLVVSEKKIFFMFSLNLCKTCDPRGGAIFWPLGA